MPNYNSAETQNNKYGKLDVIVFFVTGNCLLTTIIIFRAFFNANHFFTCRNFHIPQFSYDAIVLFMHLKNVL